ncbi:aspartate/glutamate racemase family protein [Anaeromyxobacter diazotrophicus]|uniref:Aspartate racemase n=1 Tax=Anaeromyxobacter diazotrophicus TaxID=2590199 RepID=A0A7I9VGA3_9BACT|nr:aspartate/glutamate racemase family protein [Anaeromyxobacter diazotrophicus]GEJ55421.1 aspartate racemase [Anaeromyxobacter diazotrophicus]
MKTIGLIGGMSWESTAHYYRLLNEAVKARLGGLHSAKCLLASVDFAEVEPLQRAGRWDEAGAILNRAALGLERAGADLLLICANTMHKVADEALRGVRVPLLHIADATADRIAAAGVRRVALLGTRYVMEQDFYRERLAARHHLEVIVPGPADRAEVNRVIFEELCLGRVEPRSKARYAAIMEALVGAGAQGVVAGCTEITMLVQQPDVTVPLFDTTEIHALAAVERALA